MILVHVLKIPLEYNKTRTRISVTSTITISGRGPVPVVFLVDTGSPFTLVDEVTTKKIRVYPKNLNSNTETLLGGTKIKLYDVDEAVINFHSSVDSLVKFKFDNLKVSENARQREGSEYSPISILGIDFLLYNKLSLYINPSKGIGYIEDLP